MIRRNHVLQNQEVKNDTQSIQQSDLNVENSVDKNENKDIKDDIHQMPLYEITEKNCNNECESIKNTKKKDYCKEICGFGNNNVDEENCDILTHIKKDYCIRDRAIKQHNIIICDTIADKGIMDQCRNRVSEDVIDDIM